MTENYKKDFYDNYVSNHTAPRKGVPTLNIFTQKAKGWDKSFKGFIPDTKNAIIADLGCGDGSLVWWLQSRGYLNVEGIDISAEQIELSKSLNVQNTVCGDVFEFLKSKENVYDVLIMRDLLEHLTKNEIFEILTLIIKALKPGGRLIVQVPNGASPFFGATRYGDLTHELAFTQTSLSQLFRRYPFEKLEFYSCPPIGLTLKSKIRVSIWKLFYNFIQFYLILENGPGSRILTQNIISIAYKK